MRTTEEVFVLFTGARALFWDDVFDDDEWDFEDVVFVVWREAERTSSSPSDKNIVLLGEKEKEAFDDIFSSSPGEDDDEGVVWIVVVREEEERKSALRRKRNDEE